MTVAFPNVAQFALCQLKKTKLEVTYSYWDGAVALGGDWVNSPPTLGALSVSQFMDLCTDELNNFSLGDSKILLGSFYDALSIDDY